MDAQLNNERPAIITGAIVTHALILLLSMGGTVIYILSNFQNLSTLLIPMLNLFFSLPYLGGLVGYWKMRRWGVYVYALAFIAFIFLQLLKGIGADFVSLFSLIAPNIIPLFVLGAGIYCFKKMS